MAGWWEFNNLIDLTDSPTCCTRRAGASGEHWAELVLLPGERFGSPWGQPGPGRRWQWEGEHLWRNAI